VIALAFLLRQGQFELAIDVRLGGGVTSLFGPSGAGKTTILDAIAGLRRPVSGTIALGNRLVFFGLTSLFALILLGTILYRMKSEDWGGQLSVAAVFGGAIGNLLDRVRFGEVIDFLDVYVGAYHWPAFNVADAAISVGVCFLAFHLAFEKKEPEPALQQNQP